MKGGTSEKAICLLVRCRPRPTKHLSHTDRARKTGRVHCVAKDAKDEQTRYTSYPLVSHGFLPKVRPQEHRNQTYER